MHSRSGVTVLRDVHIPGGRVADITLSNGIVRHVGSSGQADTTIRCNDLMVIPAGVDMHVHMRDGNQAYKENWESGTRSALSGGVTVVIDQPNTVPAITTPDLLTDRAILASNQAYCQFGINAGVTPDADLEGMAKAGAMAFGETFAGPSSYGEAISREDLCRAISRISDLNGLITIHAEVVQDGDDSDLISHEKLRPISGELDAVRMIREIAPLKSRVHFCHISAADTIDYIRKNNSGTIEVTPHHLFLSYESFRSDDAYAKVNPSLRSESERRKLRTRWDRIDVIGSDHAPHTCDEKGRPFRDAPSGIPGVETMIPLLMAKVLSGTMELPEIIAKTSTNPSEILGILPAGFIPGMRADFGLYPHETSVIHADNLSSKAGWTPFEGMSGVFPAQVIMAGSVVYNNGEYFRSEPVWLKGRGYNQ